MKFSKIEVKNTRSFWIQYFDILFCTLLFRHSWIDCININNKEAILYSKLCEHCGLEFYQK